VVIAEDVEGVVVVEAEGLGKAGDDFLAVLQVRLNLSYFFSLPASDKKACCAYAGFG